jgi:hypothetical protein
MQTLPHHARDCRPHRVKKFRFDVKVEREQPAYAMAGMGSRSSTGIEIVAPRHASRRTPAENLNDAQTP